MKTHYFALFRVATRCMQITSKAKVLFSQKFTECPYYLFLG